MLSLFRRLLAWLLVTGIVWWMWPAGELRHPAGVRVVAEPVQEMIVPKTVGAVPPYTITAVAKFAIEARVLHTKKYRRGGEDLVPWDVAVGWGAMSDQAVLDYLSISQANRFFFYEWEREPPVPLKEIECHAANLHVIPANDDVLAAVKRLRRGEFVAMHGYLVNATGPNGFYWPTSLRRDDTGNGACELFYVESVGPKPEPPLVARTP